MELHKEHTPETSVYRIRHDNPSAPLFFLIPGNPGLAEFYGEYLCHLKSHLPEFEYFCPSHIGFNTLANDHGKLSGRVYTLDEQIQQKIDMLSALIRGHSERPVVVMGHSVGAWMVQRVVVALQGKANFKLVGLLTPTIQDIAASEKGTRLMLLTSYITSQPGSYAARFGQLLYWTTPQFALRQILKTFMGRGTPDHAVDAAVGIISRPNILRQFADMGAEEMDRIKAEPADDIKTFWTNNDYNVWAYFVNQDHWVKDETRQEIIERYSELDNVEIELAAEDDPTVHAFCVRHSEPFAKLTAAKVRKSI